MFSFINISGLTIGITVCLMYFLFIMNEIQRRQVSCAGKKHLPAYAVVTIPAQARAPYLSGPYATALLNEYPGK